MNVFVAGGSGTIGIPLVRALVAAGHQVTALTRSAGNRETLEALGASAAVADALAVRSMETQVLEANRQALIEGVVLRYGMFYGLGVPSTAALVELVRKRRLPVVRGDTGQLPLIHIDDAVSATVLALDAAPAGSTYEIVDDRPASMTEIVTTLARYVGAAPPLRVPAWLPRLIAPYMARVTAIRMPLSNARAKAELGWKPAYPTMQHGIAEMFRHAL